MCKKILQLCTKLPLNFSPEAKYLYISPKQYLSQGICTYVKQKTNQLPPPPPKGEHFRGIAREIPPSTLKYTYITSCVCVGGGGPYSRFSHAIKFPIGKEWQRESAVFTLYNFYMHKEV